MVLYCCDVPSSHITKGSPYCLWVLPILPLWPLTKHFTLCKHFLSVQSWILFCDSLSYIYSQVAMKFWQWEKIHTKKNISLKFRFSYFYNFSMHNKFRKLVRNLDCRKGKQVPYMPHYKVTWCIRRPQWA